MNDKLEQLYNLYKQNGIIQSTDFNTFSSASDDQRKKLYDLGRQKGLFKTTDYNTFSSAFRPIKKKEQSVSPSAQNQKPTSSATQQTKKPKPSVSSSVGGKFAAVTEAVEKNKSTAQKDTKPQVVFQSQEGKRNDIFTGYPGEEGKKYRLDNSTGKPVWMEYTSSNVKGPSGNQNYEIYNTPITDPARVAELNRHFKKNASSSEIDQVFTGFPGKESNEYRVRDNKWERKEKGSKSWQTVINEGSILGLNKQFKQNVEPTKDIEKAKIDQKKEIENKKNMNILLASINSDLVGSSEEYASEELDKKFPGFKFIQQGLFTDKLLVIAPNDSRVSISLDNFTDGDDRTQATRLREFIRNNSDQDLILASEKLSASEEKERRFVEESTKTMYENDVPSEFKWVDGKLVVSTYLDKQKETEQYKNIEIEQKLARKEYIDRKEQQFNDVYHRFKGQKADEKEVSSAYAAIKKDDYEIKRVNQYMNDIKGTSEDVAKEKASVEDYTNDAVNKLRSGEITKDQFEAEYKPEIDRRVAELKNKGNALADELNNIQNVNKAIEESVAKNYIIDEATGSFGGGMTSKFVKGLTYLPRLASQGSVSAKDQEDIVRLITGGGTTKEYMESEDRSDLVKSLFSLSESMGALASGSAFGGGAATYAAFYAQSYYEMKDDLDQVEGMSETSKVLMSAVYGGLSSVLEKYGMDLITQKSAIGKNFKNNVIKKMFADLPKDASKEYIDAAMMNSIKMTLAEAGLKSFTGSLGEGVTESLQSLTQVGIKEAYDLANGSEFFNNKSGWEILSDVMYEGYLGALGGGVMSTVASSPKVLKNGVLNALNGEQAELLMNAANTEGIDKALITNLKASVLTGKITKEEAINISNSFSNVKSKINQIPSDLSVSDKAKALDLMVEKSTIEDRIAGKDPNLVSKETERINEINEQLKTISQNAVQEQTTGEVSVQPETTTGQEVEGGKPEAEPQVVTEEGKEEITIDKPTIAINATVELDRVKSVDMESEDGATFNLDGTKYEGGGLIVPVASTNTTVEEITPEMIADFVEANSGKIGDKNTVKVGIYKFPNSNKVSIDLNVVAPESSRGQAIEFGKQADQESLFDLSTFENVKTGGTGMNPMQFTDDQFKEIAKALNEGRVPNVFGSQQPAAQMDMDNTLERIKESSRKSDRKAVGMYKAVRTTLQALTGVKVFVHDSTDAYREAIAKAEGKTKEQVSLEEDVDGVSSGTFLANGEIHIDATTANAVTVFHEAFHYALMKKGLSGKAIREMVDGIKKSVKNKELLARVEDFANQYSEGEKSEEFAVELGALLAATESEMLTPNNLQKFFTIINNLFKKVGLPAPFTAASTRQDAIDFINSLSKGLREGTDVGISEGVTSKTKSSQRKRQAVTIMEGKESMEKFGLSKGKNVTRKIGEALEARQRNKYGTIDQKDNSPEARKKISNWMVDEVKYFIELMGDKSGKGWYGELYQKSLDSMSKVFPEMKTDQNARDLFTMLVAITSDGQKVMSNFRLAAAAYDYYKKNGVMPNTLPGQRVASFEANLSRINNLLSEYNGDIASIKRDLMEVKSIEEINKERRKEGLDPLSTNWPVSFKAPFAASVFGPKLGMFYSNLSGNEAYPTLDRWWSRTFNRYRGTLIPGLKGGFNKKGEALGLDRFKQLLGNGSMTNEEAILASKSYRDSYAAKGYKSGTEIEKAANTIYKIAFENLNDAPFTKNDRQFMYDTVSDAVNKLNKQGYDLSIADVQAILWYFEKNLYKTLGVQAKIEGISYEDAANYTYEKWKEAGNKFDYKIDNSEEGQAVEDADEDIESESKQTEGRKKRKLSPSVAEKLTEDGNGNYVFQHWSSEKRDVIKPGSGQNSITGKDEASSLSAVGGLAQFYTMKDQSEPGTGNVLHTVLVPMDKVYDAKEDPMNFEPEARRLFNEARPGQGFDEGYRAAFITKVANQNGFDMTVYPWRNTELRAQTTIELTPESVNVEFKDRKKDEYNVGDKINVYGRDAVVTSVDGPVINYKGETSQGSINVERSPRSIRKKRKLLTSNEIGIDRSSIKPDDISAPVSIGSIESSNGNTLSLSAQEINISYPGVRRFIRKITAVDKEGNKSILSFEESKSEVRPNKMIIRHVESGKDGSRYGTDLVNMLISESIDNGFEYIVADDVDSLGARNYWKKLGFEQDKDNRSDMVLEIKRKKRKSAPKDEALNKAKEKFDLAKQRGGDEKRAMSAAMSDLKKNDWYANASDIEREDAVRDLRKFFGLKEKSAPSVKKVLGKADSKTVTMNVSTLRDEFIKARGAAAKQAAKSIKDVQREIAAKIKDMVKYGRVSAKQAAILTDRLARLNTENPLMVERYLAYAEKVFENADYAQRLADAFSIRKKIKRLSKSLNNQAEVRAMGKAFLEIDPSMVDDIDLYNDMAQMIFDALKPSRVSGTEAIYKNAPLIEDVNIYTNDMVSMQEDKKKNEMLNLYSELVSAGVLSDEMSLKDIQTIVQSIENDEDVSKKDEKAVRDYNKNTFGILSSIVRDAMNTGIDPITGESVDWDEKATNLINRLMNIDMDRLSVKEGFMAIEALQNFMVNGITSGVEATVYAYDGALNAEKVSREGIKARDLRVYLSKMAGRIMSANFATIPVLFDSMFGGVRNGGRVMEAMGLSKYSNGVAKATKIMNNIANEYGKIFSKQKPNGESFNSAKNVYERGMLAFLKRTVMGSDIDMNEELARRISLLRDSIKELRKGGDSDMKKADIYEELFDKLGLDREGVNIIDIESRVDKTNRDAVDWWIGKWSEHYPDLYDVSLSVFNTQLGKDLNYTPDRFSRTETSEVMSKTEQEEMLARAGAFSINMDFTDKNKSGVLMEATRPKKTPGRYVDLDFDMSNSNAMKAALIDINTAGVVRQIDSFLRSDAFKSMIPNKKDYTLLRGRVNSYIRRTKGKDAINNDSLRELNKVTNVLAGLGATKALGGIFQPIKQTVPVIMNTLINAGRFNPMSVMDKGYNEWIDRSGMSIANRGLESSASIDTANKYLDKAADGKMETVLNAANKLNETWLKVFLSSPDVVVARASFQAYYKQDLKRQGVSTDIDWTNHEINQEAANYAQHMVDRQQNVSDTAMGGEFMASNDTTKKLVRKVAMPFANFVMNQKNRMYSDIRTLQNSISTKEDKITAWRSLVGLTVEMISYQVIAYTIREAVIKPIAAAIAGYVPDDEEEEKQKKYAMQNVVSQGAKDFLSPMPFFDGATLAAFNYVADKVQDVSNWAEGDSQGLKDAIAMKNESLDEPMTGKDLEDFKQKWNEDQKWKFENFNNESVLNLGTLTIMYDKISALLELSDVAKTGEFTKEYNGIETKQYLMEEDRSILKPMVAVEALHILGALPVEASSITRNVEKFVKKKGITETQKEKYDLVKKKYGKVEPWMMEIVKSKKKEDGAIQEIEWVKSFGDLNEKQGSKYVEIFKKREGQVTYDDMMRISKMK